MKRTIKTFPLNSETYRSIKQKMLNWADRFSISVFFDNNDYQDHSYHFYECLVAVNPIDEISFNNDKEDVFKTLSTWHKQHQDWLFGHIQYDYKNKLFPKLYSSKPKRFDFAPLYFFCPQTVCYINVDKTYLTIETLRAEADHIFNEIIRSDIDYEEVLPKVNFQKRTNRDEYQQTILALKEHIRNGDCYEINFCNEGFAENVTLNPLTAFNRLNTLSPAPFAAFYKLLNNYLLCSSPERYLCKQGNKIISQPIKGTQKRSSDIEEDERLKQALFNSEKDKAENVMIVDLTRNDLARSCATGSIEVEELFGIYSYPKVHQMISTISGKLKDDKSFIEAFRFSFPMGSMTGAPKMKVMELIEKYEHSRRELFSGTIGYIQPNSDFDFNVIIRSLFYNTSTQYLSYQTGGAITYDSFPENEWEESLLKAFNLERIFQD